MAGYIRQDVSNNIADGNIINASDFDNEYNAIEAAFHAVTGHKHDGTSAEGHPITKIGPSQDFVASATALTPKTDNTLDLGSSTFEYKDLYIDGVANIDSLIADTADINGGTIDNTAIGASTPLTGAFTTLTSSSTTTLNGTTIPASKTLADTDSSQTLTNKTISADNNTLSGIAASSFVLSNSSGNIDGAAAQKAIPSGVVVGTTDTQTLTNKTLSGPIMNDGYTEEVFSVSGTTPALSPTNGSIQTWTLSGNSTPTAGTWAEGQSMTLMVDDGSARTITWTSVAVTWKTNGGVAPTLNTTGFTAITLWKVGTTIYGARVGDA